MTTVPAGTLVVPSGRRGPPGERGDDGKTVGPINGVTDGSDAAPGEVGEFIQQEVRDLSHTGWATALTLQLPPGDWDVEVYCYFLGAPDNVALVQTSNPSPGVDWPPANPFAGAQLNGPTFGNCSMVTGTVRWSSDETQTVHVQFYTGTALSTNVTALRARRVR